MAARRRGGELLDVKPETLQGWIERGKVDSDHCELSSDAREELKRLRRDNAELEPADAGTFTARALNRSSDLSSAPLRSKEDRPGRLLLLAETSGTRRQVG